MCTGWRWRYSVGARSCFRWKLHPSSQASPLLSTSNRGETARANCGNCPQMSLISPCALLSSIVIYITLLSLTMGIVLAFTSHCQDQPLWPIFFHCDKQSSATITRFWGPRYRSHYSGYHFIAAGSTMDVFWLVFKQRGWWAILGNFSFVGKNVPPNP